MLDKKPGNGGDSKETPPYALSLETATALGQAIDKRAAEFDAQVQAAVAVITDLNRVGHDASMTLEELKKVNTAAASTIQDYAREERLAETRRAEELKARLKRGRLDAVKPLLFIIVVMLSWGLVTWLANAVITCIPGGAPCNPSLGPLVPTPQLSEMTRPQWIMLFVAVAAALWIAKRLVYGNNEND